MTSIGDLVITSLPTYCYFVIEICVNVWKRLIWSSFTDLEPILALATCVRL